MKVSYASLAGSARPNEDLVVAGPTWAAVLDGATAAAGVDSGCAHDVPWLVSRLAAGLAQALLADPGLPLAGALEHAIRTAMTAHGGGCDLGNPDSPSSTAAIVRWAGDRVEYLVLGDSPVVLRHRDGRVTVAGDDRLDRLPGGRPYSLDLVRRSRNTAGGFWVASTAPGAAHEAVTGSVEAAGLAGAGLFTDGVGRLVDWYGWTWESVAGTVAAQGPESAIRAVRAAERAHGPVTGKPHDDATAVWATLSEGP
ncbi:protein phosphatase 2C domain-containing protein [Nonomuraea sp. NN258]|nr:protein phosphatase 2C domain-containing protein [Nonomuraea antri]